MARRVVSRRDLRREAEAAEALGKEETSSSSTSTKTKAKSTKKTTTRKTRTKKAAKEVRKKMYWGVFDQTLKQIELFEFNEKENAQAKAEELSATKKSLYFVKPVKKEIEE
ncbi:Hypothetical protein PBC10988_29230 [Planctomycetales bacterium 10988]|nr:Hypothetical protein PBC10988_29230 [Planctomycetales bacterium 10988]